jgi:hypothetical protein
VSPVKYKLGSYIPEDDTLHSHCRENLSSYYYGIIITHDVPESNNLAYHSDTTRTS